MRSTRHIVVVSGLPASGKTTLARALGDELHLPLLDKDAILESLFDSLGCASPVQRSRLSRASDSVLEMLVRRSQGAVVTSFWRSPSTGERSGTPTEWLAALDDAALVEVLCICPPQLAADRFLARRRHPGHHDSLTTRAELVAAFTRLATTGPVTGSALVEVDTSSRVDVASVADEVRRLLDAQSSANSA